MILGVDHYLLYSITSLWYIVAEFIVNSDQWMRKQNIGKIFNPSFSLSIPLNFSSGGYVVYSYTDSFYFSRGVWWFEGWCFCGGIFRALPAPTPFHPPITLLTYYNNFGIKLTNPCPPYKLYGHPRMRSNRATLLATSQLGLGPPFPGAAIPSIRYFRITNNNNHPSPKNSSIDPYSNKELFHQSNFYLINVLFG